MIVRESINFERGLDPKKTMGLGVYVPGRLFKYKDNFGSRQNYPNVYILVESEDKKFRTYFYIGRFIEARHSLFGQEFSFSGKLESENSWNVTPIKYDKFEPLSPDEQKRINKILSDPENESMVSRIARITNVRPILKESVNFQRGLSDREIKDVIVGWREGQLVINPYTNIVYVYLKEWVGERNIEIFSVGHIRHLKHPSLKNPKGKGIFQVYRKNNEEWARTNFKAKDKLRSLTKEEIEIVKSSLSSEYINKLDSELKKFEVKGLIL